MRRRTGLDGEPRRGDLGRTDGGVRDRGQPGPPRRVVDPQRQRRHRPLLRRAARTAPLVATFTVAGATATDWEDIAWDRGATDPPRPAHLYLGDIGDNGRNRPEITDPPRRRARPGSARSARAVTGDLALHLRYPDGPHDAEALMVDPDSGDLVIVTKDWSMAGHSEVFRARATAAAGAPSPCSSRWPPWTSRRPPWSPAGTSARTARSWPCAAYDARPALPRARRASRSGRPSPDAVRRSPSRARSRARRWASPPTAAPTSPSARASSPLLHRTGP